MVNFGPLAAEIFWRVWGTPANFNGFYVLAALLHQYVGLVVAENGAQFLRHQIAPEHISMISSTAFSIGRHPWLSHWASAF